MEYQVFISYSRYNRAVADKIIKELESAGIRCWMAPRDIAPSRQYAEEIVKALEECTVFVLVLSPRSDSSWHVQRELDRAIDEKLVIIPFLIEDFTLSKAMNYYVCTCQYLYATIPPLDPHILKLRNLVCSILNEGTQIQVAVDASYLVAADIASPRELINHEIQSLLYDYFDRPNWEEQLRSSIKQYRKVFIYGAAGVGKTTLAARMAEQLKGGFFSCSAAYRGRLEAIAVLRAYYDFYQPFGYELPLLPSHVEIEDIYNVLSLLSNAKFDGLLPPFFVDGLDELPAEEFRRLVELMGRFANPCIPLAFFSRSKAHARVLHEYFHPLHELLLEPLNRDELQQWLCKIRPSLKQVSDTFIDRMMQFSEGNFLFLKGLPNSTNEEDYLRFIEQIPCGLESVFEKLLNRLESENDNSINALCLMALLPSACSRELLQVFLGFHGRQQMRLLLDTLSPVIKEVEKGRYILFHAWFNEFIRTALAREIRIVARELFARMDDCYDLIYPLRDVPSIFIECKEREGLLHWMELRIQELENYVLEEIEGSSVRYEMLAAITRGFLLLHQADKKVFVRAVGILDRFIACNFQVMLDWRLGGQIEECLKTCLKVSGVEDYPRVALLYAAVLYSSGQYAQSLELLKWLKELFTPGSRDSLRCINYIGLNRGALAENDKAIDAYSLLLASSSQDIGNIWTGYALMNRGKLYMKLGNMKACLSDLKKATEVRELVVNDEDCFLNNRSDISNTIQAELTLAMGYENLAKAYLALAGDGDNLARKEAMRYIEKLALYMDSLLEQYQQETNSFAMSARLLLTLVEYYIEVGDLEQAQHYYDYLSDCYVRSYDLPRKDKVKERLDRSG